MNHEDYGTPICKLKQIYDRAQKNMNKAKSGSGWGNHRTAQLRAFNQAQEIWEAFCEGRRL